MQRGKNGCAENIKRASDSFLGSKYNLFANRGAAFDMRQCSVVLAGACVLDCSSTSENVSVSMRIDIVAHSWVCLSKT